jgi:hypothetical protein
MVAFTFTNRTYANKDARAAAPQSETFGPNLFLRKCRKRKSGGAASATMAVWIMPANQLAVDGCTKLNPAVVFKDISKK